MDLHIYTRELLDNFLLPELKEIAQSLGVVPQGNRTRRETWVAALVGKPFPVFQTIDFQPREAVENSPGVEVDPIREPLMEAVENSPDADRAQEPIGNPPGVGVNALEEPICWQTEETFNVGDLVKSRTQLWGIEKKSLTGTVVSNLPSGGVRVCFGAGGIYDFSRSLRQKDLILVDRAQEPIENSLDVDRAQEPIENSLDVDRAQESIELEEPTVEEFLCIQDLDELDRADCPACGGIDSLSAIWSTEYAYGFWTIRCTKCDSTCTCSVEELPDCLRRDEDEDEDEDSEECACSIDEFPDLRSALAEIARLREQNSQLLEVARSQSETIRLAKDISPVEKPSLKRVLALARAACMDVIKNAEKGWVLAMGPLKRNFKKLRDIWDLLIVDDWILEDLFSPPPPVVPKPLFAPIHSKYSAVPFCDDGLIDAWSLGVNAVSSGRSPPAGGEAM